MVMNLPDNYDWSRGWEDDHPAWHKAVALIHSDVSSEDFISQADEIVNWVYLVIDNCERHARWMLNRDGFYIKFRYEKDCLLFTLRWG